MINPLHARSCLINIVVSIALFAVYKHVSMWFLSRKNENKNNWFLRIANKQ